MRSSTRLLETDDHDKALKLLDEAIAEAISENNVSWICTLSHHAAVISYFMGNQDLRKHYYEQSLTFSPENYRALYGLAKIAEEQGEPEIAKQYAARCYKAITEGDSEIARVGLLDLVLSHWPEVATKKEE